jgi:dihydrofolate reductase
MSRLVLIAALGIDRGIGKDNSLPWRLPDDLKRFKEITLGKPVVMGRKTWESLGKYAPLPGRRNIVLSRDASYQAPGAEVFTSLDEALNALVLEAEICIIGGAQIYTQALPLADSLRLTLVDAAPPADAFFPEFDLCDWDESARQVHPIDAKHAHTFCFVDFERIT